MRSLLLMAGLVGAASACDYSSKEHASARLEGTVVATVVSVQKKAVTVEAIGGGHVGILAPARETKEWCELRIEKPKKLVLSVAPPCKANDPPYRLASDSEGRRLAHAPAGGTWTIVYFGTDDRSFERTYVGPGGPIDWAVVPTLEHAFPDLVVEQMAEEARGPDAERRISDTLIDEIASRGDAELARVLTSTAGAPVDGERRALERGKRALWSRAEARLNGEGRATVARALSERLADVALGKDRAAGVVRAVLHSDVDKSVAVWSPRLAAAVLARAEGEHDWPSDFALGVLLSRLAIVDPKLAGSIGCSLLGRSQPRADGTETANEIATRLDLAAALAVVAAASFECPAVRRLDATYEKHYVEKPGDGFARGYCVMSGWFCPAPTDWRKPPTRCTKEAARARVTKRLNPRSARARSIGSSMRARSPRAFPFVERRTTSTATPRRRLGDVLRTSRPSTLPRCARQARSPRCTTASRSTTTIRRRRSPSRRSRAGAPPRTRDPATDENEYLGQDASLAIPPNANAAP